MKHIAEPVSPRQGPSRVTRLLGVAKMRLKSRPLLRFGVRRFASLIVVLLGITVISFALIQVVPGDPALANLGELAALDPAAVQRFHREHGLDKPVVTQYWIYLSKLVQGDLGVSQQSHRDVLSDLAQYAPATAELAIASMLISMVGLGFGVLAALRKDRLTDHVLRFVTLTGLSMPTFWLALLAFWLFYFKLSLVPGSGRLDPGVTPPPHLTGMYTFDALVAWDWPVLWNALHHLILPSCVLSVLNIGLLTRYTRSAVLEVLGNDYIVAARAKGMSERVIVLRHVMRVALLSVLTVAGLALANVMTGSVLVETIFSWPGIGQYAFRSATALDLPAVVGTSLVVALVYTSVNILVDLSYGILDPRLRPQ